MYHLKDSMAELDQVWRTINTHFEVMQHGSCSIHIHRNEKRLVFKRPLQTTKGWCWFEEETFKAMPESRRNTEAVVPISIGTENDWSLEDLKKITKGWCWFEEEIFKAMPESRRETVNGQDRIVQTHISPTTMRPTKWFVCTRKPWTFNSFLLYFSTSRMLLLLMKSSIRQHQNAAYHGIYKI